MASVPCGISHVAVVTGDLDGYRAFYEEVIGLETTLVLGAGPIGLTAALLLGSKDIRVTVLEADDKISDALRASTWHPFPSRSGTRSSDSASTRSG